MELHTRPEAIYDARRMNRWEWADPLRCPKRHKMIWLGSVFWICGKGKCKTIYVEEPPYDERRKRISKHQGSARASAATGQPPF